nr:Bax inhibitor-1/YccA family protein [Ktedonobacteraceae bacterium]
MNTNPYNPYDTYSRNQGQPYSPYQQPAPFDGYGVTYSQDARQSLLSKVLTLLSFSLAMAGLGLFVGLQLLAAGLGGFWIPAIILEFIVLIALMITTRKLPNATMLNLGLLYLFTFTSGMTISTIIAAYAAAGAATAIYQALALTGVLTIGLGMYAWSTKRNLSFLGPILFIGLLTVVVASIFSLFFATGPLSFIIALVSVALFSGFIVYDIQRVKFTENTLSAAILLTVSLYLDILNLFLSLLRLFGYGSNDD